jgi:hypothetical protein
MTTQNNNTQVRATNFLGFGRFDSLFARNQHYGMAEVREDLSLADDDFYLGQWDIKTATASFHIENEAGESENLSMISEIAGDDSPIVNQLYVPTEEGALPVSSVFGDTYCPISNQKFLDLIKASLDAAGLPDDVYSVGSLYNRKRVFISIPLSGNESFEVGERKFDSYLNFMNSFNGSTPFVANTSNICNVCSNSFTMNLKQGGHLVKHTKNAIDRLENLPQVINTAINVQKDFSNDFLKLASVGVTREHARLLITGLLVKLTGSRKLSTQTFNKIDPLYDLFISGKGNKGETFADLFSAFTDYYSNSSSTSAAKQFVTSNFGSGADAKAIVRQQLCKLIESNDLQTQFIEKSEELEKDYRLAQ